jgi:hypothetical protein
MSKSFQWPFDVEPPILFANSQWAVTNYGLQCLTDPYDIDAERLGKFRLWASPARYDWPLHLAEKEWVDIVAFCEAFREALRIHGKRYKGKLDMAQLEATIEKACDLARK